MKDLVCSVLLVFCTPYFALLRKDQEFTLGPFFFVGPSGGTNMLRYKEMRRRLLNTIDSDILGSFFGKFDSSDSAAAYIKVIEIAMALRLVESHDVIIKSRRGGAKYCVMWTISTDNALWKELQRRLDEYSAD